MIHQQQRTAATKGQDIPPLIHRQRCTSETKGQFMPLCSALGFYTKTTLEPSEVTCLECRRLVQGR